MELRSTGSPDTSNPVTMSMLEYLAKKGREAMNVNEKTLQSERDNYKKKHKVKSAEIVVRKIDEKPYYEIKYFDLTDNEYHIGYGSYKLEYVFDWLEHCFEIVEKEKKTNADNVRNMTDEELAKFLSEFSACNVCEQFDKRLDRCGADNHFVCVKEYAEAIIGDWLKQPVEE